MKKERSTEELMEIVEDLRDYFNRHSLRDRETARKFFYAVATAELKAELEQAEKLEQEAAADES